MTCRNSLRESVAITAINKKKINVNKKPKIDQISSNDGGHVHLKNGLFVMCSYPIKLRKSKRVVRECSPEVVALLFPEPARRGAKKAHEKAAKIITSLVGFGRDGKYYLCATRAEIKEKNAENSG